MYGVLSMSFIKGIISLTVAVILLANVFIATVKATNTTGWESSEIALWGLLVLLSIVGLVYGIANIFGIM